LNFSPSTSAGGLEACDTKEYLSIVNHTPLRLVVFYLTRKYDIIFGKLTDQVPCRPRATYCIHFHAASTMKRIANETVLIFGKTTTGKIRGYS